jgi:hypothetical protein
MFSFEMICRQCGSEFGGEDRRDWAACKFIIMMYSGHGQPSQSIRLNLDTLSHSSHSKFPGVLRIISLITRRPLEI